jgi:K+-sensing histidine kinase KdpD
MQRRSTLVILLALACPWAVVAAIIPLRGHLENTNAALGLVVIVLAGAVLGGRRTAFVAAVSAAVAFDVFLTRPFYSLRITSSDDVQTTVLLVVIGVIAGELVERVRRNERKAAASQAELRAVYERAQLAAGAESSGQLIGLAVQELTRLLDLKSCRYVPGPLPQSLPGLRHDAVRVPAKIDPATQSLVALPVRAHGVLQGNFVLAFPFDTVGVALSPEQRRAAVALADHVGAGLARFHTS